MVGLAMNVAAFLFFAAIAFYLVVLLFNALAAIFIRSEDAHYHRLVFGTMLAMLVAYLCLRAYFGGAFGG